MHPKFAPILSGLGHLLSRRVDAHRCVSSGIVLLSRHHVAKLALAVLCVSSLCVRIEDAHAQTGVASGAVLASAETSANTGAQISPTLLVVPLSYHQSSTVAVESAAPTPSPTGAYSTSVQSVTTTISVERDLVAAATEGNSIPTPEPRMLPFRFRSETQRLQTSFLYSVTNTVEADPSVLRRRTEVQEGPCVSQIFGSTAQRPLAKASFNPFCNLKSWITTVPTERTAKKSNLRPFMTISMPKRRCEVVTSHDGQRRNDLSESARTGVFVSGVSDIRYRLTVHLKVWGVHPNPLRLLPSGEASPLTFVRLSSLRPLEYFPWSDSASAGPRSLNYFSGTVFGVGPQKDEERFTYESFDPVTLVSSWYREVLGNTYVDVTPSARSAVDGETTSVDCFEWEVVGAQVDQVGEFVG